MREYGIEGIKHLAMSKFLTMLDTLGGQLIHVITNDYSLRREISQFLSPDFLEVQ